MWFYVGASAATLLAKISRSRKTKKKFPDFSRTVQLLDMTRRVGRFLHKELEIAAPVVYMLVMSMSNKHAETTQSIEFATVNCPECERDPINPCPLCGSTRTDADGVVTVGRFAPWRWIAWAVDRHDLCGDNGEPCDVGHCPLCAEYSVSLGIPYEVAFGGRKLTDFFSREEIAREAHPRRDDEWYETHPWDDEQ